MEALANQVSVLTRSVIRPISPVQERSAPKQVTFDLRPSRSEVQCYNFHDLVHISRDSPKPNSRWPKYSTPSENGSAGPAGQGRQ